MHLKHFLSTQSRKRVLLAVAHTIYRRILRPAPQYVIRVDRLGIPIVFYRDRGPWRNPVTVCNYALKYYQEGNDFCFLNCANWLVKNLSNKGSFSVWEYDFPWEIYNLRPPWVSGMAQGLGIKVLVSACKMTEDKKFMKCAFEAFKSFTIPIEEGGVLQVDRKDGGWWFEEYASPSSIRSYVLNGYVFALEGLHELCAYTKNKTVEKTFSAGVAELKRHLHEYDTGSWTYYDRLRHIASWEYHNLHIDQMNYLWETTGDVLFRKYYGKWRGYAANPFAKLLHE